MKALAFHILILCALLSCGTGPAMAQPTSVPALPRADVRVSQTSRIIGLARPYMSLAQACALEHGHELELVLGIIEVESFFDTHAISRVGARGLMQLMPGVIHDFGVTDAFDPAQNVSAGCAYLALLLRRFDGRLDWALAAYNAGPARVRAAGGPLSLTYVSRVFRARERWRHRLGTKPVAPAPLPASRTLMSPGRTHQPSSNEERI